MSLGIGGDDEDSEAVPREKMQAGRMEGMSTMMISLA